ncbi:MAG: PASTA domain-containing protein [Oscillospiraceae bacterium]|nr:PASTA domain-containing protein [Oscillospiraceae bacterium]
MNCIVCQKDIQDRTVCPFCGQSQDGKPVQAWHLNPGTLIKNRYYLGTAIGSGGFGITYFAWDRDLSRAVAVKEYLPSEFATRALDQTHVSLFAGNRTQQFKEGLQRYVDEAHRLAQLHRIDGIAQVYDYFEDNGTGYIVMEYIPGITFEEYLKKRGGKIDFKEAISFLIPIMEALKEVHKHGIIHRDVSPDNILITEQGSVNLIDFGAARYATTSHSKSLSVLLKPGYAPEEQYRSQGEQGPWSDVYAMGATLYRSITGEIPPESLERMSNEGTTIPRKLKKARVGKNISNAIMNAMMVKAEYRYQSMDEFIDALVSEKSVDRLIAPAANADAVLAPGVKKGLIIGISAAALVLVLFIGFSLFMNNDSFRLFFGMSENQVNVPDVLGRSVDDATLKLSEKGFNIQVAGKEYSDKVPADMIILQSPQAGQLSDVNANVEVQVSRGPVMHQMQNILYLDRDNAELLLEAVGFKVMIEEIHSDYAPGIVIEQEYAPGEMVKNRERIKLIVSKGIEGLEVGSSLNAPDIINKTFQDAKLLLLEQKVYIKVSSYEWSDTVPEGAIISQEPNIATEIKTGDIISVEISKGVEHVMVPDVQYMKKEEAIVALKNNKLVPQVMEETSESVKEGYIISQDLSAESMVSKNSKIVIKVSVGGRWSEGVTELPAEVTDQPKEYEVRDIMQYSSMEYIWTEGEWSNWGSKQSGDFAAAESRYRIQEKQTTTSTSSTLSGWINTGVPGYSPWGTWSSWSSTAKTKNDLTDVEIQYRTRTKEYQWSTQSSISGWTKTATTRGGNYTDWSGWSSYSTTRQSASDIKEERSKTQYYYNRGIWWYASENAWWSTYDIQFAKNKGGREENTGWLDSALTIVGSTDGRTKYSGPRLEVNNPYWWNKQTRVVYSYRTRSYVPLEYYYYRWNSWTSWTTGSPPAATTDKEVEVQYRYRTRNVVYNFYRWTDFSAWKNGNPPDSSANVQVQAEYRYKSKNYYWTEWGPWGEEVLTETDTLKVQTRKAFRYRKIVQ